MLWPPCYSLLLFSLTTIGRHAPRTNPNSTIANSNGTTFVSVRSIQAHTPFAQTHAYCRTRRCIATGDCRALRRHPSGLHRTIFNCTTTLSFCFSFPSPSLSPPPSLSILTYSDESPGNQDSNQEEESYATHTSSDSGWLEQVTRGNLE